MIPDTITSESVEAALKRIRQKGVPRARRGRGHCLVAQGRHYPPKYVISLAHEVVAGKPLDSGEFEGGRQTNRFLDRLGFEVVPCRCGGDQNPDGSESRTRSPAAPKPSVLRVALVFPTVAFGNANGIPAGDPAARHPELPAVEDFAGEAVDVVLFPEAYISSDDDERRKGLEGLAAGLGASLLVGAACPDPDDQDREWQVLLQFDPGAPACQTYVKHSTADAVAFKKPDWDPDRMLPTKEMAGVRVGATICHDHYLGLLPRHLARSGAQLWVNPSFDNVVDIKWSSVLRLRAVENRFFALCTLHDNVNGGRRTHPFAFSPCGREIPARQAGSSDAQPLSLCSEADRIYIVELDIDDAGASLDWSMLPGATKPKRPRNGRPKRPVRIALENGHPAVRTSECGCARWKSLSASGPAPTSSGQVFVGLVPGDQVLDAAACFAVIDEAARKGCDPIIWNHWDRLPTDSGKLASLMMGRSIECCAPVVISDPNGIHELVELSNQNKIPARRTAEPSGEWILDAGSAWGLKSAFKMVAGHLPKEMRETALKRYRGLM